MSQVAYYTYIKEKKSFIRPLFGEHFSLVFAVCLSRDCNLKTPFLGYIINEKAITEQMLKFSLFNPS